MEFYDVIRSRSTVKSFNNDPIDEDKLMRIITAVSMSPSWRDNTSYQLILVDDEDEKNMLANTILNDDNNAKMAMEQAPMAAVIVGDPSESGVVADKEYYLVDSAIAMEHFVLAATNEGYGTYWIGAFDEDKIRNILSIPKDHRVVAMTPLGESSEINTPNYNGNNEHAYLNKWGKEYDDNNKLIH